ncbi:hypothetical protein Patl1_00234 [Pistacia atlantica]|uniref:Uncharacterized protein n=1 Tax=Pistacia atlantica TaxID=434234 RepID=A0ACC1C866_9ROSI|nr:hypothetical protein Patl1_00234 [Pistacia atlantica]
MSTSVVTFLFLVAMATTTSLHSRNWRWFKWPDPRSCKRGTGLGLLLHRMGSVVFLRDENHTLDDARTWLSRALAHHRTCLDGLEERGYVQPLCRDCKEYWYSKEQELNERELKLLYYSLPTMGLNSYKIQTCS